MQDASLMKWINSSDLVQWSISNSKDAEQNISLLIRFLIREKVSEIESMRFPAGDATRYSGWDGILEFSSSGNSQYEFIPNGTSFWEFGTGTDYWKKANKDYKDRVNKNKGYNLKNSTFVFVTTRIWEDDSQTNTRNKKSKTDWIRKKLSDNIFKNVIALDARDLEEWIQLCPNAGLWLANHIGKFPPSGIESLIDFWDRWSFNPVHILPPKLLCAGRSKNVSNIIKWLKEPCSAYTLKALTREEAVAFLFAALNTLPENEKNYFLERSIIVKDIETFIRVSKIHSNHILINFFDNPSAADYATLKNNHVLIPITPDNLVNTHSDELKTLGVYQLIEQLEEMGIKYEEASQLSKDSGKSISILRSLLKFKQQEPEWLNTSYTQILLTALLIGKWNNENQNDKAIISFLSCLPYEEFVNKIIDLNNFEDPPTYIIGNQFGIRSQYYLWSVLAGKINKELLTRFFEVVNKVLFEIDPEYYLDEDDRYRAQFLGVKRTYSNSLRKGLLNSLILLSIFGELTQNKLIATEVDNFINLLLNDASEERWFSVADILPELAEASPHILLKNLEDALKSEASNIKVLFREGKDKFTARCNHSGLFWALEALAWDEEYLLRATFILVKLISLKKDDSSYSNNAEGSLRNIYLSWHPNTTATIDKRIEVIDALIEQDRDAAFELLLKLMPVNHDIAHPTYKFKWRKFGEYTIDKTNDAYKSESKYYHKILELSGLDGRLLARLIPFYDNLHNISDQIELYNHIKKNLRRIKKKEEVREALRKLIFEHKSFPNADWSLPQPVLDDLQALYNSFPIKKNDEENRWLFDEHSPNIDFPKRGKHSEYEKKLIDKRIQAIKSIYSNKGLKGIIQLSTKVKKPYIFGSMLSKSNILSNEEELKIIRLLISVKSKQAFAKGYVINKIYEVKNTWINRIVHFFKTSEVTSTLKINFLSLLEFKTETWELLKKFDKKINKGYWKNCNVRAYELSDKEIEFSFNKLIEQKRYLTLLDSIAYEKQNVPTEIIIKVLQGVGTEKSKEPFSNYIDPYRILELFKILDERNYNDENVMVKLEWLFIDILTEDIYHRPPKLLIKEMGINPNFYLEIIRALFKPENDQDLETEELKNLDEKYINRRADIAWKLLRSFKVIPGTEKDGIVYNILKDWVDKVIELSNTFKRRTIVEDKIGELLAFVQPINGIWPPEEVCKIIEYLNSSYVDEAFCVSIRNQRGTVSKSMFEGGQQELDLEKMYNDYAQKINSKYPRIIQNLKSIAQSYKREAIREDERAERDKMQH